MISCADEYFLSTREFDNLVLFAYSEQNKTYTYYIEITFEQKIIKKKKFIVLKTKKNLYIVLFSLCFVSFLFTFFVDICPVFNVSITTQKVVIFIFFI